VNVVTTVNGLPSAANSGETAQKNREKSSFFMIDLKICVNERTGSRRASYAPPAK
jgi:hypothetical protein